MLRLPASFLCCIVLLGVTGLAARAESERDLLRTLTKEYVNPSPADRAATVKKLENASERTTWQWLVQVAQRDPDPSVKAAAFETLCKGKDPDGSLARMAAACISGERDKELKKRFMAGATVLEFKTDVAQSMVEWIAMLRYPEYYTVGGNSAVSTGGSSTSNRSAGLQQAQEDRAYFQAILESVNKLTNENFQASDKCSREIKDWFAGNRMRLLKADADLLKKKREEARQAAGGK